MHHWSYGNGDDDEPPRHLRAVPGRPVLTRRGRAVIDLVSCVLGAMALVVILAVLL